MENERKAAYEKEYKRIKDLMKEVGISEKKIQMLDPIIQNTSWIKIKLEETMEAIRNAKVVITYDNGGGQKGIRENPMFKGYESLWKSYMMGMKMIIEAIPETYSEIKNEEIEKPKTMLEIVRARKQA